jgi:hypothetical protein
MRIFGTVTLSESPTKGPVRLRWSPSLPPTIASGRQRTDPRTPPALPGSRLDYGASTMLMGSVRSSHNDVSAAVAMLPRHDKASSISPLSAAVAGTAIR